MSEVQHYSIPMGIEIPRIVFVGEHLRKLEVPIGWRVLEPGQMVVPSDECANVIEATWISVEDQDFMPDDVDEPYTDEHGVVHARVLAGDGMFEVVIREDPIFTALRKHSECLESLRRRRIYEFRSAKRRLIDSHDLQSDDPIYRATMKMIETQHLDATRVYCGLWYNMSKDERRVIELVTKEFAHLGLEIVSPELYYSIGTDWLVVACGQEIQDNLDAFWKRLNEELYLLTLLNDGGPWW